MVYGLEKFKDYFSNYTEQYVFIGGTACDILMDELGTSFRATKDLDIVLIIEALKPSFGETFWKFINDGGYKHRKKSTGNNQFYRFMEPADRSFPKMIELFSRQPYTFDLKHANGMTPIHIDESVVSLSAILLDDAYYHLLINGKTVIDNYSVIEIETVILFKIKAWLDLKERKDSGEPVDMKNIKKHKNDIFRLLSSMTPGNKVGSSAAIQKDIENFIVMIVDDKPDLKNIGIINTSFTEFIELLKNTFL